jgi:hypothetical protein
LLLQCHADGIGRVRLRRGNDHPALVNAAVANVTHMLGPNRPYKGVAEYLIRVPEYLDPRSALAMTHWTGGSRVKVERAKKHFGELHFAVRSFFDFDSGNYQKVPEDDSQNGDAILRLHWVHEPPLLEWGGMAGDVIHNLWSALDVAVHQLFWIKTRKRSSRGFPILPNKRACGAAALADIGRCSQAAVAVIKKANPYKGGEGDLWLLQALDNESKHHVLTTVAHGILAITSEVNASNIALLFPDDPRPEDRLSLLKLARFSRITADGLGGGQSAHEGAILSRIPAALRDKVQMDPNVTFDVAINEPEIVEPRPLLKTLYDLLLVVDGTIGEFATIP